VADPAVVSAIRDLVVSGGCEAATDLSQGGLIAALAALSPSSSVELGQDPLCDLFSESAGRFLLAVEDEAVLEGLPYRIIGKAGGEGLRIRAGRQAITLSTEELERARSSLTRLMRS
jgi:phosphoribosylformylglycinamidine synthase